nr:MAG TPA: hypothetical protein [Caudoviricetes sp.]
MLVKLSIFPAFTNIDLIRKYFRTETNIFCTSYKIPKPKMDWAYK